MLKNKKNKELLKYIFVGLSTVLIDFLIYKFLIKFIVIYLAKTISFLSGTFFSYQLNRTWTFKSGKKTLSQFIKYLIIHITSLVLNVFINSLLLNTFSKNYFLSYEVSFLIATLLSAIYNFLFIKFFIFNNTRN
ncbi:GtrA family protein [Prochlorococcus sp. MIT 0604]|uniref:GtrA family protein n=1 Tax=Prochlorococcus sp. MIT 0604 TaxID=1501268 RepID=UPI0005B4A3AD